MLGDGALDAPVAPKLKGAANACGLDGVAVFLAGAAAGCGGARLKMDPEKPADTGVFRASAVFVAAKGLGPPAEKLKPDAVGGVGLKLKPVFTFAFAPAPKAGKDELTNDELGVADCAGGKLLVAPPKMPPSCCCGCWSPKGLGC